MLFIIVLCINCNNLKNVNNVTICQMFEPDMLNPINTTDGEASHIADILFQSLVSIDHKTLRPIPVLASECPIIEKDPAGNRMLLTFKIRQGAYWDNGIAITAKDIEFSLKVIKNPLVNDPALRAAYYSIKDFLYYQEDSLKFTIVTSIISSGILEECCMFPILPRYIFDSKHYLDPFPLPMFTDSTVCNKIIRDKHIVAFANDFNSSKFGRDPHFVIGSGPYKLKEWIPNQRIVLNRKKNWWGNKYRDENDYFMAYPEQLIYEIITDPVSAIIALKNQKADVVSSIPTKDFIELEHNNTIISNFNLYNQPLLTYSFIGINIHNTKLNDVRVRQALAQIVDVNRIIKDVGYGLPKRINGPILPFKKEAYNDTISFYNYNLTRAKQLLNEAGWFDSDGDGILYKKILGVKTPLKLSFMYANNSSSQEIGLILKEAARIVGIDIEMMPLEWSTYRERLHKHDFELFYGARTASTGQDDLSQIWSTNSSISGGDNVVCFGDSKSDNIIKQLEIEIDSTKRDNLYKEFQLIVHEQVPYIFLFTLTGRIAINKRLSNTIFSPIYPGYWEMSFKQNDSYE